MKARLFAALLMIVAVPLNGDVTSAVQKAAAGAIAVDASSPARVTDDDGQPNDNTVTTAAFDPPASVLVATYIGDTGSLSGSVTMAMSNNGGALTWTAINMRDASDSGATEGYAGAHYAVLSSSRSGMTVTCDPSPDGYDDIRTVSCKVYVITGADTADVVGSISEGSSGTNNLTTTGFTAETLGLIFGVGNDWNALGSPTSSDLTYDSYHNGAFGSGTSGYKTITTTGGTTTTNLDAGGSGAANWNWVNLEIRKDS